ncbi:MAG: flagellar basal body P-ring protein FlgI [Victivallales bacterium]|nr:flagellar basal body P-ring protein FlgI [Victivallales bacterium]
MTIMARLRTIMAAVVLFVTAAATAQSPAATATNSPRSPVASTTSLNAPSVLQGLQAAAAARKTATRPPVARPVSSYPADAPAIQTVRIKDATRLKGQESYELVGYGLVTGLNDTGDSDKLLIQQTIANMLQNFNIVVNTKDIKANNTAAVMVTVTIRGNHKGGDMVDANVSALGDCDALTGGTLIMTPLLGADGEVWGMAQGPVTTGGYTFGSKGAGGDQVTKNHPTAGMLTNGVKLLRDFGPDYNNEEMITLILNNPDFTSAVNMAKVVNRHYVGAATVMDAASIQVRIPGSYRDENNIAAFISAVGQLYFAPDSVAKVVFNERTGTIVIGQNVRISNAAVSHGNLFVRVKNTTSVSQPGALAPIGATSQRMNDQQTVADEEKARLFELKNTTTVGDLVDALNGLGVGSRDIMIIFHVLKSAGALHAELEAI